MNQAFRLYSHVHRICDTCECKVCRTRYSKTDIDMFQSMVKKRAQDTVGFLQAEIAALHTEIAELKAELARGEK